MGKRILIGSMVLTLMLAITGCGNKSTMAEMRIQPAVLTPNETSLIELINSSDQSSHIFEYNVDSNAQTVAITAYKLDDEGKWVARFGPSSFAMQATTGRIAISFDNIDDGMGIAMQDNTGTVGSSMDPGQKSNLSEMTRVSSFADIVDIEYDKEVPLAMQVFSSDGDMISGAMDTFYHPEKLLKSGYDEVFVVVIEFSKKDLQ
jgi:hypothetical protein